MDLKIKVCGMREPENISALVRLKPDYIGFIFYDKSPRFVGDEYEVENVSCIPSNIIRTGVFVDSYKEYIESKISKYQLGAVQLHGKETPQFCSEIAATGVEVFKAFSVDEAFVFCNTEKYASCCNFFLFDTKTQAHGGSGQKFDWNVLCNYKGAKPFILSGGISGDDAEAIKKIAKHNLYAIDINSRFEISPALKNIEMLETFFGVLKR